MRPYRTLRLTEHPDVADIRAEGRHSRVGRLDEKSYTDPKRKRQVRRTLKRIDKRRDDGERWCPDCHDSYNIAAGCECGRK